MTRKLRAALKALGFTTLRRYERSPLWTRRRARYFRSHRRRCACCPATRFIVLHHRTYDRVGRELDSDLVPLCRTCHQLVHLLVRWKRIPLATAHRSLSRL